MLKFENVKPWQFRANNLSGVGLYCCGRLKAANESHQTGEFEGSAQVANEILESPTTVRFLEWFSFDRFAKAEP